MKLDEGDGIVDVQICTENDDVLLTTAGGQCIRFPVADVRVFAGRTSMGVRGINLEEGDKVISLSILRHVEATADERAAYLKRASAVRRGEEGEEGAPDTEDAGSDAIELGEQRYVEMSEAEQFVLTVSENGMGKRSSSFQYRTTGRGGKGIVAMSITPKTGKLVASFPVEHADQIMLVTDKGQLIRTQVDRHPHRRALDPRRDRVRHGGRRARGLGRTPHRRGRGERRRMIPKACSRT